MEFSQGLISKHLMLLFNLFKAFLFINFSLFQNISCYCLTCFAFINKLLKIISKHLMLLFNDMIKNKEENEEKISKHLMLLFNA